ncbi:hypothetical protein LTR37_004592 [Vermiconidia calcicola]|uniref:Uncharacterized protein n=1 Tax=Vermiconidia calcicola TaxID=1690605 RepID=A0ACC3NN24_9PEZI|nr:hypothetical protein LTR37_004592 [Vermiconidia calcicola]
MISHRLVFVSRLIQLILGSVVFIFAVAGAVLDGGGGGLGFYYGFESTYALLAAAISSTIATVFGIVGMFASVRPNDIHWHLVLTLDWMAFWSSVVTCALFAVVTASGSNLLLYIFADICAFVLLLALLLPIIRTHRLRKQCKLPAPHTQRHMWYDAEAGLAPKPVSYYEPQTPKPMSYYEIQTPNPMNLDEIQASKPESVYETIDVRTQASRQMSQAGTAARWSGVSGADTTAFRSMLSERGTVPPYTARAMSHAGTTIHSKF